MTDLEMSCCGLVSPQSGFAWSLMQEPKSPRNAGPHMIACRIRTSSMIDRVAFDADAQTLCISFRQTGRYVYEDVPRALFDGLCTAASAGTYFNERIKGHFRCRRDPARRRFGPNA